MTSYKFKLHAKAKNDGFISKKITRHLMLYNRIVELCDRFYRRYHRILRSKTINSFLVMKKKDPSWAYLFDGLNAWAIQETVKRHDDGFNRFFKYLRRKAKDPKTLPKESPPQKHKIHSEGSYTLHAGNGYKLIDGGIATGLMWNSYGRKKDIRTYRFFGNREILGNVRNVIFKRDRCGDIWCIVTTDHNQFRHIEKTGKVGGFDYSQEHFFIGDDGRFWNFDYDMEQDQKELASLRRKLDRTQSGSKNRRRIRLEIARLCRRMTNKKRTLQYELAWRMCKEYDVLCFEHNDFDDMKRVGRVVNGHKVSKKQRQNLWELSPSTFLVILKDVAKKAGKTVFFADRHFASSQICSNCGHQNKALKNLKVRKWKCLQCGMRLDRDINAAKNLVKEFEIKLGGVPSLETETKEEVAKPSVWERIRKSASVKRAAGSGEKSPCPQSRQVAQPENGCGTAEKHPELYTDACKVQSEKRGEENQGCGLQRVFKPPD